MHNPYAVSEQKEIDRGHVPRFQCFCGAMAQLCARFPAVCNITDTSKFASQMDEDNTSIQRGPFSSTEVEDFACFLQVLQ